MDDSSARILELRKRLGMTHDQVAEAAKAAGVKMDRAEISKVESGKNSGRTEKWRTGLAAAFGVPRDIMSSYIDGDIGIDAVVNARVRARVPGLREGKAVRGESAGTRLRALREALSMSTDDIAARSGDELRPIDVTKAEAGVISTSTPRWGRGLGNAFGMTPDDVGQYLDGKMPLTKAVSICKSLDAPDGPAPLFPNRERAIEDARAEAVAGDDLVAFEVAVRKVRNIKFVTGGDEAYLYWRTMLDTHYEMARRGYGSADVPGVPT